MARWRAESGGAVVPEMRIVVETPVSATPRVRQVCGVFDLAPQPVARVEWHVALPLDARPWHIGLIVGPSGCGKSTIARHLFADAFARQQPLDDWPGAQSILDALP